MLDINDRIYLHSEICPSYNFVNVTCMRVSYIVGYLQTYPYLLQRNIRSTKSPDLYKKNIFLLRNSSTVTVTLDMPRQIPQIVEQVPALLPSCVD